MARHWWVQDALRRVPLRKQLLASIPGLVSEQSLTDLRAAWLRIPGTPNPPPLTPLGLKWPRQAEGHLPGSWGSKNQELLGQAPCPLPHIDDPSPPTHINKFSSAECMGGGRDQEVPTARPGWKLRESRQRVQGTRPHPPKEVG